MNKERDGKLRIILNRYNVPVLRFTFLYSRNLEDRIFRHFRHFSAPSTLAALPGTKPKDHVATCLGSRISSLIASHEGFVTVLAARPARQPSFKHSRFVVRMRTYVRYIRHEGSTKRASSLPRAYPRSSPSSGIHRSRSSISAPYSRDVNSARSRRS